VSRGICDQCKKKRTCKYKQPEGWVLECEEFEEDTEAASTETPVKEDHGDSQQMVKKD